MEDINNILRIVEVEDYIPECEIRCLINKKRAERIISILKLSEPVRICYTSYRIYKDERSLRCYPNGDKEFKMLLYKKKVACLNTFYSLCVSMEKKISDFNMDNVYSPFERKINRYSKQVDDMLLSLSKDGNKYELELEFNVKDTLLAQRYIISLVKEASYPFNMPTLPPVNINTCNYKITNKLDGTRCFLFCTTNLGCWSSDRNQVIRCIDIKSNLNAMLDCELVDDKYYVLDIVKHNADLEKREIEIKNILENLKSSSLSLRQPHVLSDGLILTSKGNYTDRVYKIKKNNTIDIQVLDNGEIVNVKALPTAAVQCLKGVKEGIFEISLDGVLIKERKDKNKPNSLYVIKRTIKWQEEKLKYFEKYFITN